jgi:hypothetical protein
MGEAQNVCIFASARSEASPPSSRDQCDVVHSSGAPAVRFVLRHGDAAMRLTTTDSEFHEAMIALEKRGGACRIRKQALSHLLNDHRELLRRATVKGHAVEAGADQESLR